MTEVELQARTKAFFDRPVDQVASDFLEGDGMVIVVYGTDLKLRVVALDEFRRVGRRWSSISNLKPGDLWNPVHIRNTQSLVVTQPMENPGSCVRLTGVEFFHPLEGFVSELDRDGRRFIGVESDIAPYLSLSRNDIHALRFIDDSRTLYLPTKVGK